MQTTNQITSKKFNYKKWIIGIIIILAVFLFVPVFLAGPDGLERVMEDQGVAGPESSWTGIFTDYTFWGIQDPFLSSLIAGVLGTLIIFLVAFALFKFLSKKPVINTNNTNP
ncbi:MAG: PDGLE domain-containing protein [Promethearchaeota archaeon]